MADPTQPDDHSIWPVLSELAACLCNMMAEAGTSGCFCGILAGPNQEIPIDSDGCDNCGAGYVRLESAYPSTIQFPEQDQQATCRAVMAFPVTVGIVRCAPVGDSLGNPPEPKELNAFARQVFADMALIRRAIACCLVDDKFEDIEYVMGEYTQRLVEGGTGGGEWQLTIRERF